jgi:hypothetical protein
VLASKLTIRTSVEALFVYCTKTLFVALFWMSFIKDSYPHNVLYMSLRLDTIIPEQLALGLPLKELCKWFFQQFEGLVARSSRVSRVSMTQKRPRTVQASAATRLSKVKQNIVIAFASS